MQSGRTYLLAVLAGSILIGRLGLSAEARVRSSELRIPGGRTGFTLLSTARTGIHFTNVLDEWSSAANRVLENGSGVAMGDFDADGAVDLFLCSLKGQNALFRNLGDWRFQNVTARADPAFSMPARGAIFADINGDRHLDLLITGLSNGVVCLLNEGSGKFKNATDFAGTRSAQAGTTMALSDVD